MVYRVVHTEPLLDDVPAEIRPLIARCLAKDPALRPTSTDILAELGEPDLTGTSRTEGNVEDTPDLETVAEARRPKEPEAEAIPVGGRVSETVPAWPDAPDLHAAVDRLADQAHPALSSVKRLSA